MKAPKINHASAAGQQQPDVDGQALEAAHLAAQIRPLLAGRSAAVQGVALVELLAMWLAGHIDPASEALTARHRRELLAMHLATVEELVPAIAKGMGLPW